MTQSLMEHNGETAMHATYMINRIDKTHPADAQF